MRGEHCAKFPSTLGTFAQRLATSRACEWLPKSCARDIPQDEATSGVAVDCVFKGRNLQHCSKKVADTLAWVQASVQEWRLADFADDQQLATECLATVRYAVALSKRKMLWCDELPYILSRLGEAGIAQRALELYDAVSEDEHLPITRKFLSPDSPVRAAVEACPEAGGDIPAELAWLFGRCRKRAEASHRT